VDTVRLVMLYALHYEKHASNDINGLVELLKKRNVSDKYIKVFIINVFFYKKDVCM